MPIERRIREGAERNAGVIEPDVDRFLESVVHKAHRRRVVRGSLTAIASVAVLALVVVVGPQLLDDGRDSEGTVPGGNPTTSAGVPTPPPLFDATYVRSIPKGTAVVRANGIAGDWTIQADSDGRVRLLAPATFEGSHGSSPFEMQPESLQTDALNSDVCAGMSAGRYDWVAENGVLSITVISDPCDARVAILTAGPWEIRT